LRAFAWFPDDEIIVALDEIAIVRPIHEGDLDPHTGHLQRHIPFGAQSRIDLKSGGWTYVTDPVPSILRRLQEAAERLSP
jgi:hypothetical protein